MVKYSVLNLYQMKKVELKLYLFVKEHAKEVSTVDLLSEVLHLFPILDYVYVKTLSRS